MNAIEREMFFLTHSTPTNEKQHIPRTEQKKLK